jgi:hypothetical protein
VQEIASAGGAPELALEAITRRAMAIDAQRALAIDAEFGTAITTASPAIRAFRHLARGFANQDLLLAEREFTLAMDVAREIDNQRILAFSSIHLANRLLHRQDRVLDAIAMYASAASAFWHSGMTHFEALARGCQAVLSARFESNESQ